MVNFSQSITDARDGPFPLPSNFVSKESASGFRNYIFSWHDFVAIKRMRIRVWTCLLTATHFLLSFSAQLWSGLYSWYCRRHNARSLHQGRELLSTGTMLFLQSIYNSKLFLSIKRHRGKSTLGPDFFLWFLW